MNKLKKLALVSAAAASLFGASLGSAPSANAAPAAAWETLAQCESGGNWSINTGNGYYGGLQFSQTSWVGAGGTQYASAPHLATKAQQIATAENLLKMQGWGAWPSCAAKHNLYAYGTAGAPATVETTAPVTNTQPETTVTVQTSEPVATVETPATEQAPAENTETVDTSTLEAPINHTEYVVKKGDTLSEVAYAHGYHDWERVAEFNKDNIPDANVIEVGDIIKLPSN